MSRPRRRRSEQHHHRILLPWKNSERPEKAMAPLDRASITGGLPGPARPRIGRRDALPRPPKPASCGRPRRARDVVASSPRTRRAAAIRSRHRRRPVHPQPDEEPPMRTFQIRPRPSWIWRIHLPPPRPSGRARPWPPARRGRPRRVHPRGPTELTATCFDSGMAWKSKGRQQHPRVAGGRLSPTQGGDERAASIHFRPTYLYSDYTSRPSSSYHRWVTTHECERAHRTREI
jgi:hypothetical protein